MAVIVFGPMGCGKTRNAERLARHFNCTRIVDGWGPWQPEPMGEVLILTVDRPATSRALVVSFDFAMRQIAKKERAS